MAGFGAIIGGALEGYGNAGLDEAKAAREAKLQALRDQQRQTFEHDEAAIGRDAQAAENQKGRDAQAAEAAKNREVQGTQYGTAETGEELMIRNGKATTVTGPDGKPVKLLAKASDQPAEVRTMEYLLKNGIAKDAKDAWRQVRSARTDPDKSRAGIYKLWVTSLTASGQFSTAEEIQAEALKRTDAAMSMLDDGSGDGGDAAADPYANDTTAPAGASKTYASKPGELRAPMGDGTKDRPYKAGKQTDVDWFKKYAKPGQMIEYGGTIYTK